ncbi:MAG: fibronectin type III domain-containing protein [Acidimicrobiia bacterium]
MALLSFGVSAAFATDPPPFQNVTMEGHGTWEQPYQIDSCEKLQAINEHPENDYILTTNIDCTDSANWNSGAGFVPIEGFTGKLDGRNHSIDSVLINTDGIHFGLFKTIGTSSAIRNLEISNSTFTNTRTDQENIVYSGALVGYSQGTIENINVQSSSITSVGTLGGVVGANDGTLNKITTNIRVIHSGSNRTIGGVVGINKGTLSNSSSQPDFSSLDLTSTCGGLVGILDGGTITKSLVSGSFECLSDGSSVGGLAGKTIGSNPEITYSLALASPNHANYFDGTITGSNSGADLSTDYYNSTYSGPVACDANGDTTCVGKDLDTDSYFIGNTTNAPLDQWNFDTDWTALQDYFPVVKTDLPPTPLSIVSVNAVEANESIGLNWNEVPVNDTGTDITGYQVSWTTDNGQTYQTIETTERSASIENADPHLKYEIRVRARNSSGLGLPTYPNILNPVPDKPNTPTATTVLPKGIGIEWNDQSSVATSYTIQYKKSSDSEWINYNNTSYPSASAVIFPLEESTSYDIRVGSTNDRGTSDYSDVLTISTTAPVVTNVSTCAQLQDINSNPFNTYVLTNDIDCSDSANWNNGEGFIPIGGFPIEGLGGSSFPFMGTLDGAGHKITDLYMNRLGQPAGLFFGIVGATVKDLTLDGGHIAGSRPDDGTVYTDSPVNPVVGTIASLAANSVIDNVHSNIDLSSAPVRGVNGGAGGLVGLVMPSVFGPGTDSTNMTISNSSYDGTVGGLVSGGLVGGSILIDLFTIIGQGTTSAGQALPHIGTNLSLNINNSTASGDVECLLICGGVVGASIGDLNLTNVTRNGNVGSLNAGMSIDNVSNFGDVMAMIITSGPFSGGLVGGSLPISFNGSKAGFTVTGSTINGNVVGTAAGGITALSLPAISLDLEAITQLANDDSPDMNSIMNVVLGALTPLLTNDGMDVSNTTINADITCTVLCGGISTLSLAKTVLSNITVNGDITNNNAPLLDVNPYYAMCPAQITGGLVGLQVLFPLSVSNSNVNGNITVTQSGTPPNKSLVDIITTATGNPSTEDIVSMICSVASIIQGTGGVVGSFISPVNITGIIEAILGQPSGTYAPFALNISGTNNKGSVTSSAQSATGGLAGFVFGKSTISNSSTSGDVSNSTFAEMFRTPISSASTGGIIGQSVGGFDISGNPIPLIMYIIQATSDSGSGQTFEELLATFAQLHISDGKSIITGSHATGNIYSSNSAGGLIGNHCWSNRNQKSYATGNVYGVAAGGLVGSGFNMGALLGVRNLISTISLENTYSRGNVYAVDDPDTITFAGGLVGFMAHFGRFEIKNSYSTGAVGVENNATNTRLVAGGLVGGELDLNIVPTLLVSIFSAQPEAKGVIDAVFASWDAFGISLKEGVSIENSFTTSSVPAHSQGQDRLFAEVASGNPSSYKTTGSLFGFFFSHDKNAMLPFPSADENGNIDQNALGSWISSIRWRTTDDIVTNTYYDKSNNNTNICGATIPPIMTLIGGIMELAGGDGSPTFDQIMDVLPKLQTDSGSHCAPVNTDASTPNLFKNNKTVAPLNTWDFTSIWYSHASDYPTFTPDPTVPTDPENPNPATETSNPKPRDNTPFVPDKPITRTSFNETIDKATKLVPNQPPTEVLDNVISKVDGEVKGKIKDDLTPKKDTGFVPRILGIMSATGAFLLRHLLEAIMIMIVGGGITYLAKRKREPQTA